MPLGGGHLLAIGQAVELMADFPQVGPRRGLIVSQVGHEVSNVKEVLVTDRTGEIARFVHPVAMPVGVFPGLCVLGAERVCPACISGWEFESG